MSENIKFNVIIPTRERADTLYHCLRTVITQEYENLSIIVSDNYSQDNTKEIVDSFADPRIRYINTGKRISMSHNWEFALSHATEGWVTILGDDDGLLPGSLFKVAELIESNAVYAIRSRVCPYLWPGVSERKYGQLGVPINFGFEIRDAKTWLSKVLKGFANYTDLPMLYNGGFVSCSLIKKIKNSSGIFYQSSVPDVYSAMAFSSIIDNYIYSNEPFAINGASKHSTGTAGFSNNKDLKDSVVKKFLSEDNIPFHPDIPICADGCFPLSLQAQVYESYLQSKNLRDQVHESNHQRQLEVILATSGRHAASVREWGKLFAKAHGLDYEKIQSKASRKKIVINLASFPGWISREINTCHVGSPKCPINDVYEASIIASAIRNAKPCRLKNIHRVVKRLVEIIWGIMWTK